MPGFNITGDEPNARELPPHTLETNREHRWRIVQLGPIDFDNERFLAESVLFPNVDIQQQEINASLLTYKFAKNVRWDDVTITLYDTQSLYQSLELQWLNKVFTNIAGIRSHAAPMQSGYKQDTILELLDGDGRVLPGQTFTLKGSWPRRISHGNISFSSSAIKLLTLTIAYDFAEVR